MIIEYILFESSENIKMIFKKSPVILSLRFNIY